MSTKLGLLLKSENLPGPGYGFSTIKSISPMKHVGDGSGPVPLKLTGGYNHNYRPLKKVIYALNRTKDPRLAKG
jgi:hypothetical protein